MSKKENNRTMKQIISDAVERELAKEPLKPLTFEEFQELIEAAEERRRKRQETEKDETDIF